MEPKELKTRDAARGARHRKRIATSGAQNTQRRTAPFECGCTGILRFRDLPPIFDRLNLLLAPP